MSTYLPDVVRPGLLLYGYCGGHFGRDSYDTKRVEAVGADWVVVRTESGTLGFYSGRPEDLLEFAVPRCAGCCGLLPAEGSSCPRCGT